MQTRIPTWESSLEVPGGGDVCGAEMVAMEANTVPCVRRQLPGGEGLCAKNKGQLSSAAVASACVPGRKGAREQGGE